MQDEAGRPVCGPALRADRTHLARRRNAAKGPSCDLLECGRLRREKSMMADAGMIREFLRTGKEGAKEEGGTDT